MANEKETWSLFYEGFIELLIMSEKEKSKKILKICNNKPVSLEVFADEYKEMKKQALQINTWGKNVYVKIPVANSKGIFMGKIIKELKAMNNT